MSRRSSKLYVGMDVHKDSIDLALAEERGEVCHFGRIGGLNPSYAAFLPTSRSKWCHGGMVRLFVWDNRAASSFPSSSPLLYP